MTKEQYYQRKLHKELRNSWQGDITKCEYVVKEEKQVFRSEIDT